VREKGKEEQKKSVCLSVGQRIEEIDVDVYHDENFRRALLCENIIYRSKATK
jgi:hypothetical protein